MDANELIRLLEDPARVAQKNVEELKRLSEAHPFSQPLQLLYAIRLRDTNEHLFNQQLGKASLLTYDRSLLFDLFEGNLLAASGHSAPVEAAEPVIQSREETQALPEPETDTELPVEDHSKTETADPIEDTAPPIKEEEDKPKRAPLKATEPETGKSDFSHLPPAERVRAILEENRKLRESFADKKEGQTAGHEDSRLDAIKDKLKDIKERQVQRSEEKPVEDVVREELSEVAKQQETLPEVPVASEPPEAIEVSEVPKVHEISEGTEVTQVTEASEEPLEESFEEPVEEQRDPVFTIELDDEVEVSLAETEKPLVEKEDEGGNDDDPRSFMEWIDFISKRDQEDEAAPREEKAEMNFDAKMDLLDSFMEKLPELKQKKSRDAAPEADTPIDMGDISKQDEGSLVTETLARVYVKQKHFSKAIKAYEILKLKYPEKSGFFASRILEIKKLINNK